jgi:WD40 repeat protein
MTPFSRGACPVRLIVLVICGLVPAVAYGTTYDMRPRKAILFEDSKRFVALDGWNSLALYRVDGSVVHRFPAPDRVDGIALSPDERYLLVVCNDGSLVLWRVATGERVWLKGPVESGLKYPYGVSFAANSERFAACDHEGKVIVFDTPTCKRIGSVSFPPRQTSVVSVALASDGTSGFLVTQGHELYSFDVSTRRLTNTELTGAGPVLFSSDGKYIAFLSGNSDQREQLSVVRVGDTLKRQDIGKFSYIGRIQPAGDGSFLLTERIGDQLEDSMHYVGVQVWPDGGRTQEVWRGAPFRDVNELTAFNPRSMIAVSTDFRLVTQITDLRSGKVLQEIDNSANSRLEMLTTSSVGRPWQDRLLLWGGGAVAVLLLAGILIWRSWARR